MAMSDTGDGMTSESRDIVSAVTITLAISCLVVPTTTTTTLSKLEYLNTN